jgi:hypothetical protein
MNATSGALESDKREGGVDGLRNSRRLDARDLEFLAVDVELERPPVVPA